MEDNGSLALAREAFARAATGLLRTSSSCVPVPPRRSRSTTWTRSAGRPGGSATARRRWPWRRSTSGSSTRAGPLTPPARHSGCASSGPRAATSSSPRPGWAAPADCWHTCPARPSTATCCTSSPPCPWSSRRTPPAAAAAADLEVMAHEFSDPTLHCLARCSPGWRPRARRRRAAGLRRPRRGHAAGAGGPPDTHVVRRHLLHRDPPVPGLGRPGPDACVDLGAGAVVGAPVADLHVCRGHPDPPAPARECRGRVGRRRGGDRSTQRGPRRRPRMVGGEGATTSGEFGGGGATRLGRRRPAPWRGRLGAVPQPGEALLLHAEGADDEARAVLQAGLGEVGRLERMLLGAVEPRWPR